MNNNPLPDQSVRREALDGNRSFIVQAPAGSGKTELLTLRYLCLLASSEQPEEVLAITFTRKAASEMRDRIIRSLRQAQAFLDSGTQPEKDFERQRHAAATAVLERDSQHLWRLLENPSRLRVQTIDSFCSYLANQLPVLSRIGGNPSVSEEVEHCFSEAIANTLQQLETESPLATDISRLLGHLDNDVERVERLLISLLHKRDQWLPYVLQFASDSGQARHYLHNSLEELVQENLTVLRQALTPFADELVALLNYSSANLLADGRLDFTDYVELEALPDANAQALPYWKLIAELLLTTKDTWRKSVNVRNGFPPGADSRDKALSKARKRQFSDLQARLAEADELQAMVADIRLLPPATLASNDWEFLVSLLNVLGHLGQQLVLAFRKLQLVDYTETSSAALTALGPADNPTDLALALDHRIQHILVDEFQDTSLVQLQLLQRLTAGWQPGDGRSLFLVGDPMQSCYGFRNANVGIYLQVKENGINELLLEPLLLQTNFRSQARIVNWVNEIFAGAFPSRADVSRGAVPYSASAAVHGEQAAFSVSTRLLSYGPGGRDDAVIREARQVIAQVRTLQEQDPGASIAVLARSRSHFSAIIDALRSAGIDWQATDIDRMGKLMVVEDLLSLTRALLNPVDRLAWLALLRAPWCGLDARDLLAIANLAADGSIWQALNNPALSGQISADKHNTVTDFIAVMNLAMNMRCRRPVRQLVEATWTLLRGADCCGSPAETDSAIHYFNLLDQHDHGGSLANLHEFQEQVLKSFVPSPAQQKNNNAVQLLTMHKAKGLEFDHVILPALARAPGRDDKPLLLWHERLNAGGESRLFLAGLTATGTDDDQLYRLLRHEQTIKTELENTRLLYIAVTRARKSATLFATLEERDGDLADPPPRSLLSRIWPQLRETPAQPAIQPLEEAGETTATTSAEVSMATPLRYLEGGIQLDTEEKALLTAQIEGLQSEEQAKADTRATEDSPLAACIGTLIHRALENHVSNPATLQNNQSQLNQYWRRELSRITGDEKAITAAMAFITRSLEQSLADTNGQWIFDSSLADSACELTISRLTGTGINSAIVDRTFVDDNGIRWIIDYKTTAPGRDQSEADFIAEQQAKYAPQLDYYRDLFTTMEDRPIKTALYFTALPRLVELPQSTN